MIEQAGYTTMDAHDGSQKMLDIAAKRGIFKECIHELMAPEPAQSVFVTGTSTVAAYSKPAPQASTTRGCASAASWRAAPTSDTRPT